MIDVLVHFESSSWPHAACFPLIIIIIKLCTGCRSPHWLGLRCGLCFTLTLTLCLGLRFRAGLGLCFRAVLGLCFRSILCFPLGMCLRLRSLTLWSRLCGRILTLLGRSWTSSSTMRCRCGLWLVIIGKVCHIGDRHDASRSQRAWELSDPWSKMNESTSAGRNEQSSSDSASRQQYLIPNNFYYWSFFGSVCTPKSVSDNCLKAWPSVLLRAREAIEASKVESNWNKIIMGKIQWNPGHPWPSAAMFEKQRADHRQNCGLVSLYGLEGSSEPSGFQPCTQSV